MGQKHYNSQIRDTILSLCRCFVFAVLTLCPCSAEAIVQELNQVRSKVNFSLNSPFLVLAGKLKSYSGTLNLNQALDPKQLKVKLNLSQVKMDPVQNLGNFPTEGLFRTLPDPIVTFVSSSIKPMGKNKFRVEGTVRRGTKEWPANFHATLLKRSVKNTEFHFATKGPITNVLQGLPAVGGGTNNEGSVDCHLVFSTVKP